MTYVLITIELSERFNIRWFCFSLGIFFNSIFMGGGSGVTGLLQEVRDR